MSKKTQVNPSPSKEAQEAYAEHAHAFGTAIDALVEGIFPPLPRNAKALLFTGLMGASVISHSKAGQLEPSFHAIKGMNVELVTLDHFGSQDSKDETAKMIREKLLEGADACTFISEVWMRTIKTPKGQKPTSEEIKEQFNKLPPSKDPNRTEAVIIAIYTMTEADRAKCKESGQFKSSRTIMFAADIIKDEKSKSGKRLSPFRITSDTANEDEAGKAEGRFADLNSGGETDGIAPTKRF